MVQDANSTPLKIRRWKADDVYRIVNDPVRRRIIFSLAKGEWKTALEFSRPGKRHTFLKHFQVLRKAGVLLEKENPKDLRRPLFALSPAVVICESEKFITAEFGHCLLRFAKG